MSIREGSEECSISPLEVFDIPPTQTAIEKSYDVEYLPTSALQEGGVVEFYIPASNEDYVDLKNSKLYIKAKITNDVGGDLDNNVDVAPVNNFLQSMWSNVELMLNDRLVTHSNNVHGYTSMLSHLLHDSDESLASERPMQMVYKDTPGQMDATNVKKPNETNLIAGFSFRQETAIAAGEEEGALPVLGVRLARVPEDENVGNNGLHKRFLQTQGSKAFELYGSLRLDLFEQLRYLPNGISIKLRLHQQKRAFSLMSPNNDTAYKIKLLNASFILRKVKPSPGVLLGHADGMTKAPAQFPIVRKECKSFAIPAGLAQFKQDNIFLGQLPSTVVLAMVTGRAFSGSLEQNPFNFQHFNVNLVQLYADGEPVRSRPFRLDMETGSYVESFCSLFSGMSKFDGDRGSIIKYEDWPRGYSLFAFSLSPDAQCDDHSSLIKHGNLRIEVQFAQALEDPIQLLVYAEFDNIIKIDSDRQVLVDYV